MNKIQSSKKISVILGEVW